MSMLLTTIFVLLVLLLATAWLAGVTKLAMHAMDLGSWKIGAIVMVIFWLPIAIGLSFNMRDAHPTQLCLAGHERWHRVYTRFGGYDAKEWVCTEWER